MPPSPPDLDIPDRRRFVRGLAGLVPIAACAGCAQKAGDVGETATPAKEQTPVHDRLPSLPVEERWGVLADRVERAAAVELTDLDSFVAAVERDGPAVTDVKEYGTVLELTCELDPGSEPGAVPVVGHVAGSYAALVRAGTPFVRLDVTLEGSDGDAYGSFQIQEAWATRYEEGEWSPGAYGEAALGTLKTKR